MLSETVLPGQVSAFCLTAGKHDLIYTTTVTTPWERRKNARLLSQPTLLKLIFIQVCV